ncbi:MAG: hypothetical protein AAF492_03850, partial [Verrucomicrobiota bacterium]
ARRRRQHRAGVVFLLLRLTSLGLTGWLFQSIFWGPPTDIKDLRALVEKRRVVVLQDGSGSMQLRGTRNAQRTELADALWDEVDDLTGRGAYSHIASERLFFGENTAGERNRLQTNATLLNASILSAVERRRADALVVVSDGASHDGTMSWSTYNIMTSRHTEVYGVLAGDPDAGLYDFSVAETAAPRAYPKRIRARVTCTGQTDESMKVELWVDEEWVETQSFSASASREVAFELPELEAGWHSYTIRIREGDHEVSDWNNHRHGVFQNMTPRGALAILDRPSRENVQLLRRLHRLYPDEVTAARVSSSTHLDVRPDAFLFVVIGNVAPDRLPPEWLALLKQSEVPRLFLAGDQLAAWSEEQPAGFPLDEAGEPVELKRTSDGRNMIGIADAGVDWGYDLNPFKPVAIDTLRESRPAEQSRTLLHVRSGSNRHPLLVAGPDEDGLCLALLCETTWKWTVDFDARSRRAYDLLFETAFRQLAGSRPDPFALKLKAEEVNKDGDAMVRVTAAHPDRQPFLREVQLHMTVDGETRLLEMSADRNGWFVGVDGTDRNGFIRLQAFGRDGQTDVSSVNRPLAPRAPSREFMDPMLQPDTMKAIAGETPGRFVCHSDAPAMVRQILDGLEKREPPIRHTRRNPIKEWILAGSLILLLGFEWFIERRVL